MRRHSKVTVLALALTWSLYSCGDAGQNQEEEDNQPTETPTTFQEDEAEILEQESEEMPEGVMVYVPVDEQGNLQHDKAEQRVVSTSEQPASEEQAMTVWKDGKQDDEGFNPREAKSVNAFGQVQGYGRGSTGGYHDLSAGPHKGHHPGHRPGHGGGHHHYKPPHHGVHMGHHGSRYHYRYTYRRTYYNNSFYMVRPPYYWSNYYWGGYYAYRYRHCFTYPRYRIYYYQRPTCFGYTVCNY